ncbi:MAG: DUF1571 domain-containing protein [Phycisphaerae bacterium]|nr:DUF1571 domain-containing protein [Phycisphaerae bacterium]
MRFPLKRSSNRNRRLLVGVLLCAAVGLQCQQAGPRDTLAGMDEVPIEMAQLAGAAADPADEMERLAREDPLAFFQACRDRYDREVQDYDCTFIKQELVEGKLTAEQWTSVRFREEPYSVDMTWTRNPMLVSRALYVEDKWWNGDTPQAWVRPAGALLKLVKLKQPIRGKAAGTQSRRTIDQFGFRNSLDLIIHYSEKAQKEGVLDLEYIGQATVGERPTYVFERRLPYNGDEEIYPDRLLRVFVDKEWLLPTCCISYADDDGSQLLGKYVLVDVKLNPGYTDADFDPEVIGF